MTVEVRAPSICLAGTEELTTEELTLEVVETCSADAVLAEIEHSTVELTEPNFIELD